MKGKLILSFIALLGIVTLSGCNRKTAREIMTFVNETYTDVFSAYTQYHTNGGPMPDRSAFDKKYLTESLQTIINNEEFIDADYWIQAQDFTTPTFNIVDCHVTDKECGYADISIKVFGDKTPSATICRVVVKKEKGSWKIDDFRQEYNGNYIGWK